jgi:molybdopterin biosynthesis enzyme
MVRADALAVVPAETTQVAAGSEVLVQLVHRDDLRERPGF